MSFGQRFFITGTDTGIGKTYCSRQLLDQNNAQGKTSIALKPLASGCEITPQGLRNEDALLLQAAASIHLPYAEINPFAFEPPIAPHLAAAFSGQTISAQALADGCHSAFSHPADLYLIEGAGGWQVPLNQEETWPDFVKLIQADVILVVGMRLGCINHALLTAESILHSGCHLAGWIANALPPDMPYLQENIAYLKTKIPAPLLLG
jgi:dethiobiotin synthetase